MKSLLKYVAAVVLCAGLFAPDALAIEPVPNSINIQGVLRNVGGEVVTGNYSIKFQVYDAATGGNLLCQHLATISVTGGVFNTAITCPATAFINKSATFLGITVGADAEMTRIPMTSVGFAIQAQHAEQADELLGAATDLACLGCVGADEVAFNYAASDRQGGPATDVNCSGCVSGGAPGDIAAGSITTNNIGANEVKTGNIDAGAVTNAKLATDSVYTGNIKDGQVTTLDLATGAVTSVKIGNGAVGDTQLSVMYAAGTSKGGPAADLNCTSCVSDAEAGFNYALGKTKGGAAAGLDCLAAPCVEAGEVTFTYAGSLTQGGAASDVACVNCIGANEVEFNYAASATENGAASDLACTNCVASTEVNFNYANSNSRGGDATGVACSGECISTGEVDFNWAASASKGGAANGLICSSCVQSDDIEDGAVVNADISGPITGSKITTATTTDLGVVKIGNGIAITAGSITPDYAYVAQKDHEHAGYFEQSVDNLEIGDGKYITFLDPGDNPGSYPARLSESTASGDAGIGVRMSLGVASATPQKSFFEIWAEGGLTGQKHFFDAGGNARHYGNLQFDGNLTCKAGGCINSTHIINESITTNDIDDGTIQGTDLNPAIQLTTSGKITAGEVWASKFVDTTGSGAWYADPASTSVMNQINFTNLVFRTNNNYGMKNNGSTVSTYTSTLDAGAGGETLFVAKNVCGAVDVFGGGSCGYNTMTVHGTIKAKSMWDEDGGNYYVDPGSHSILNTLETATAKLPATGTSTNYISGTTYAFSGDWIDADANGYYVDPSDVSSFNVIYARGFRTSTWPGDPGGTNGQFGGDGSNLYIVPPPNGAGDIYLRNAGVNKINFNLEGTVRTSLPSFRTDGGYLVINANNNSDKRLLLNWDVSGGTTQVVGNFITSQMADDGSPTCVVNGGGTTALYSAYSYYLSARQAHFINGLRVDDRGIYVAGSVNPAVGSYGKQWRYGIVVNNGAVIPQYDNQGTVGVASKRWAFMYSVNSVWTSDRKLKKDIRYLKRDDMRMIGEAIQQLKPATWLYNEETAVENANPDGDQRYVRNVPHVGLILDEMPDLISNGGEAWYANDSVGFLLVAAKYMDDKLNRQAEAISDMEERLAILEQAVVDAGLYQ